MQVETIILLVVLGCSIIVGIGTIIIALIRGDMKKFIEAKMVEAESMELGGKEKLEFVLKAVKEKYKVLEIVLNVKAFIEHIIALSKKINAK